MWHGIIDNQMNQINAKIMLTFSVSVMPAGATTPPGARAFSNSLMVRFSSRIYTASALTGLNCWMKIPTCHFPEQDVGFIYLLGNGSLLKHPNLRLLCCVMFLPETIHLPNFVGMAWGHPRYGWWFIISTSIFVQAIGDVVSVRPPLE